jgi:hypothetical protein
VVKERKIEWRAVTIKISQGTTFSIIAGGTSLSLLTYRTVSRIEFTPSFSTYHYALVFEMLPDVSC